MAVYYLDTSALVKRYARESGTAWVLNLTTLAAGHDLHTV
jgi:predicted nucleic acid-binding protein